MIPVVTGAHFRERVSSAAIDRSVACLFFCCVCASRFDRLLFVVFVCLVATFTSRTADCKRSPTNCLFRDVTGVSSVPCAGRSGSWSRAGGDCARFSCAGFEPTSCTHRARAPWTARLGSSTCAGRGRLLARQCVCSVLLHFACGVVGLA